MMALEIEKQKRQMAVMRGMIVVSFLLIFGLLSALFYSLDGSVDQLEQSVDRFEQSQEPVERPEVNASAPMAKFDRGRLVVLWSEYRKAVDALERRRVISCQIIAENMKQFQIANQMPAGMTMVVDELGIPCPGELGEHALPEQRLWSDAWYREYGIRVDENLGYYSEHLALLRGKLDHFQAECEAAGIPPSEITGTIGDGDVTN